MQQKVLLLFAHPALERSTASKTLLGHIPATPGLTFHDLYEAYPEFNIDVEHEKALLKAHDVIVWHHPIYWYSCPPLLKQWIDLVLEFRWAYGPGGTALAGKKLLQVVTSGGGRAAYQSDGFHGHTLREFLLPFKRTAELCKMEYLPPFAVQGTHRLDQEELHRYGASYEALFEALQHGETDFFHTLQQHEYTNDWLEALNPQHG